MKKRVLSMMMCLCLIVGVLPLIAGKAFALYPDEPKWVASGNPYGYNWIVSDDNYEVACTTIAWQSAYDNYDVSLPNWGNGGSWWDAAGAYSRGYSPAVGAIACWSYNDTPGTGHVAYVTAVNGPDSFNIYEGGRSGAYGYDHGVGSRTITRQGGPWPDQGFIYVGSKPQTSVSFTPWEGNETYIRETDASVGMTVSVTNGSPSFVGMVLYNASGAEVARGGDYGDWVGVWYFKINEELGYTLTPGTTYKYKFYAIVNGQTYWSHEQSFSSAPSAVSASFAIGSQYSVAETNAALATRLTLSGAVMTQVSRIGVYLYDASGKQLAYIDENASIEQNYSYLDIWYDVNSELHYTLTPGTNYKYKFFAVINGKTFWSDEWSFKTGGPTPISYSISLNRSSLNLTAGESTTLTATVSPTGTSVTWSSSNTSVATVSGGKVTAVGAGTATITAKAGDKTATCAVTVSEKTVAVTGVSLSRTSLTMKQGDTATLTAMVLPADATDKTVTWSSNNPSVATVSSGIVTAVAEGTATITAAAGGKTASCTVTVSKSTVSVTGITLSQASLALKQGDTATLTATVLPADATDKAVTWSSSNSSVATVSGGRVTAVAEGTATITARTGSFEAICFVTVSSKTISVTDVFLNQTSLSMKVGDNTTLYASVSPSNATEKSVTWSSSYPSVATVSGGKVTAVGAGTATITAAAGGKTASCIVTVEKKTTLQIGTSSVPDAVVGTAYLQTLIANTTDSVSWVVTSGSLPAGLSLSRNGVISGTPTTAGTFNFTVTASNNSGSDSKSYSITVSGKNYTPSKTMEFNGHTYELYDVSLSWEDAQQFCSEKGGYLAAITTQAEQSFINTLLPGGKNLYWIGLKNNGGWTWADGEAFSYSNWATGEPTGGSEKWVQLYGANHDANFLGQWNDILNEGDPAAAYYTLENTGFICEYGTPNDPVQADVHFPRVNVYHQDQFTDVKANQWFTDTVASAFEMGLMKGNSETTFNPYGDVTIAEAITMAARVHSIATTGSESFLQTGTWYQVYLDYAFQNGIIDYAYYNSDVTQKATRAQFAEIFAKSLPSDMLPAINQIADNAVPDVPMSAAFSGYVYLLYRAGILTGSDALGTFNPQTYITRAEAATIVSRMAESSNRVAFSL